jgi:hypothetical protein
MDGSILIRKLRMLKTIPRLIISCEPDCHVSLNELISQLSTIIVIYYIYII